MTNKFFEEKKIPIISARNMCAEEYPDEFEKWKIEAFKTLTKDHKINRNILTNLMSIGDSNL